MIDLFDVLQPQEALLDARWCQPDAAGEKLISCTVERCRKWFKKYEIQGKVSGIEGVL